MSQNELQPIRFQGKHFDIETGLHYNRFRYYDSDVGMFTTRDPIGLLSDLNVFAYAPNPTGWTDSLGLHPAAAGRALIGSSAKTTGRVIGKVAGEVASAEEQSCTSANCKKKCLPATEVDIRTVLSPTNEKTIQKSVSSPVIQAYVNMIEMGQTSMPLVKISGNTIVDENHRFIAAKLCRMNAPTTQWNISPSDANKAYPIRNINIDSSDWGNR